MYPKPGSQDAITKGCTCDPERQGNPNWTIVNPKCPIHGGVEYIMWQAQQGGRKRKGNP